MQLTHILDGCLDAGDYAGAALAVLSHPFAQRFDREQIDRLFCIGALGKQADELDQAFLSLMGDMVRMAGEIAA